MTTIRQVLPLRLVKRWPCKHNHVTTNPCHLGRVKRCCYGPAVPSQISCVSAELCRLDLSVEGTHVWKTEVGGVCARGEA